MPRISPRGPALVLIATVILTNYGCTAGLPKASEMLAKYPTPVYSLTGEILTGAKSCEEAQADWLKRVDRNDDGSVDLEELLAEARLQFARMDLDHNGLITAETLSRYRNAQNAPTDWSHDESGIENRNERKRDPASSLRPSVSQPDPVLSADTDLDFQVTLDEFLTQQRENMRLFDKNNDDRLDALELDQLCRIREQAASPHS